MFKKIAVLSLLIAVSLTVSSLSYADFSAGALAKIKCSADFRSGSVTRIIHEEKISEVFIPKGYLNAEVEMSFGSDCANADCILEYKFLKSDSSVLYSGEVKKEKVTPGEPFYIGVYIPSKFYSEIESIKYKLKAETKDSKGNVSSMPVYYYDNAEDKDTGTEVTVDVKKYKEETFDVSSDLHKIVIPTGDQSKDVAEQPEERKLITFVFEKGAFSGSKTIRVNFINPDTGTAYAPGRQTQYPLSEWEIVSDSEITFTENSVYILNAPVLKEGIGKKFVLQKFETNNWEDIVEAEIIVNADTFECRYIPSTGHYRVMASKVLENGDYRPEKRVVVKGRNKKFTFKHLSHGDSVKIFNMNGKKIREIQVTGNDTDVDWDGTTDNGKWAKSGMYMYQIKVGGKTVNGTIAFVK